MAPAMVRSLISSAGSLFVAPVAPKDRPLSPAAKYALLLLLFALTRLATMAVFELRAVDDPDAAGYIATADYIAAHGHVPAEHDQRYRQFPGLSMLMVVVNALIRNMAVSGYVIVLLSAAGTIVLVQYLFDDFRLSVLFVCFYPWWITTTSEILSEGPVGLCLVLGYWAMRDARPWSALYLLGLLAAGYGIIIRQTAVFMLLPFVAVFAFRQGRNDWRWGAGAAVVALTPLAVYLAWNWLSIGELLPQAALQKEYMQQLNQINAAHYAPRMLDWPGRSLWDGLTDPHQPLAKKAMILAALVLTVLAGCRLVALARASRDDVTGLTATAFAAALATYLAFHLCIGGISGFRALDRYLSQLVFIIDWGLFYRTRLRWPWIALLCAFFLVYAFFTDIGKHSLGFIK
jgi:hypothetical protein